MLACRRSGAFMCAGALLAGLATPAAIASNGLSDYGVRGLIDMPTALMSADGAFNATYARQDLVDIYAIGYQVTPWLEASFRYSIFNPRDVPGSSDGLFDRSFEAKVQLFDEDRWRPAVAVGLRDLLGTGVWEGEYVVATRTIGPAEVTAGVGWGRLSDRDVIDNPLRLLADRFDDRTDDSDEGGTFNVGNYFAGRDVGVFGGMRYRLPDARTSLIVEYNSDAYRREELLGTIEDPSPWSIGVEWAWTPGVTLAASWQHGEELGLRLASSLDTRSLPARRAPNGARVLPSLRLEQRISVRGDTWYDRLVGAANASGIFVRAADPLDGGRINLVYSNGGYQLENDAVQRLLDLARFYVPPEYGEIIVTGVEAEGFTHSVHYRRPDRNGFAEARFGAPVIPDSPEFETDYEYPRLGLSANLGIRPYIFDPDSPFLFQLFARASADLQLGDGWLIRGSWIQNLYDDFDEIERESNSRLQRVRSDIARYLKEGTTGIDRLLVEKRGMVGEEVFYHGFAGILEEMYAGVGAEVLYRPFGSRFAVGANVIGVRQRDFDRSLDLRGYETVIGHVSGYWASPIYDLDFAVHAGRFLARDWGATFEVERTFANGWSVGAFATFTDVPFSEFGEGSFDKGITLRVPLGSFAEINTGSEYETTIRPLLRDGGQRLPGYGTTLWDLHRDSHVDHLVDTRERMWP